MLGWHSATGFANNDPADVVIGQLDFLHTYANQGGAASLTSLNSPQGVATDSDGNLYAADLLNSRVTEYTSPFAGFTGTPLAGQSANFAITATNLGLGESLNLTQPAAVAVDGNNNLFTYNLITEIYNRIGTLNGISVMNSFVAIPEPDSFTMFSLGVLTLVGLRTLCRRRLMGLPA